MSNKSNSDLVATVTENIAAAAREELTASTNSIHEALVLDTTGIVNKLPESVFVEVFLPYFAGEKQITKENSVMNDWVSIAGTPNNEVAIVGADGTVLYRVPAIYDTSILNVTHRNKGESLNEIYTHYDLQQNNLPVVAERFLTDSLTHKVPSMLDPQKLDSVSQRWAAILATYGRTQGASVAKNASADTDDLTYD